MEEQTKLETMRAKHAAYMREWYRRNPEKLRAQRAKIPRMRDLPPERREALRTRKRESTERCREAHREKANENGRRWRKNNPDKVKAWIKANIERVRATGKRTKQKLRREVLQAYGGVCACCGENNTEFLNLDHANGNGAAHRREVGRGHGVYFWARRNNFPKDAGLRVLCHNCNVATHYYGYCPHKRTIAV